jgi:hypothetical protein
MLGHLSFGFGAARPILWRSADAPVKPLSSGQPSRIGQP